MSSAIVIIDMQNDYCDVEGFYAKRDGSDFKMNLVADRIVDFYNDMSAKGEKIVCFSIVYAGGNNPCIKGTWGSNYYKIVPQNHFYKTEFSC